MGWWDDNADIYEQGGFTGGPEVQDARLEVPGLYAPPPQEQPVSQAPAQGGAAPNYQDIFMQAAGGRRPSQAVYADLDRQLSGQGFNFQRDSSGIYRGRIQDPSGMVQDTNLNEGNDAAFLGGGEGTGSFGFLQRFHKNDVPGGWSAPGGPAAATNVMPQNLGDLGNDHVMQQVPASAAPAMPPAATGAGGGAGGWDGEKFTSTPLTAAQDFTPQNVAGPAALNLASLSQPGAVTADQVGPGAQVNAPTAAGGERVTASQVTGPGALTAQQLQDADPLRNLSAEELQQDPSYQFRLKQGLGAMQNSAAAKGTLFGGATLKGLNDYAGQSASQEYAAANQRARDVQQGNITNRANTVGQNNAANAQAYGLTNQFGQAAQLANQSANMQAGQFNSAQQQAASAQNVGNQLQAGQFNSAQAQQAALANQGANLQAGQFNAGMNFNTQQGNISNQLAAYNAYQPLAQQNAQFNAGQTAAAAQNNFANRYAVEQANNANAQNAWQGNVGAQLGQGNLANAQASTANQYALGQGNIALGYAQNATTQQGQQNQFQLGLGNLGVAQGHLGLAGGAQQFNQGLQTFNANQDVYRYNNDSTFNQNLALANLGLNSAGNYGNQQGNAYTNQGNANAAAGIAGANAWSGAIGNIGNAAQQGVYWNGYGGNQSGNPYGVQ